MSIYEILILSLALALDALIVSFSYGTVIFEKRFKNALFLSSSFGFFQFLMPILGWKFTDFIYSYIEKYSKWIVFVVFIVLSIKFLKEAFSNSGKKQVACISPACMFSLAIATSIDAFGAGVSIKLLNISIILPSIIIGLVTFILSFVGFYVAVTLKSISEKNISIVGAILLFYLAVKSII